MAFSAFALALLPALPLVQAAEAEGGPEAEAAAMLERAEEHVREGRHAEAVRLYEKLAEQHPTTAAGAVALRRNQPSAFLGQTDIVRNGPSSNRVDIVFLGDGYTLKQLDSFDDIAGDVPRIFERDRVFGEYFSYLNILRGTVVSEEDGIDAYGKDRRTALGGKMSDGEQGQVTVDRDLVRKLLVDEMPDADGFAVVLVRLGTLGTGGGGVAAVAEREFDTIVHEWGHAFGNLQDEYSSHTGFRGETRSSANVSNTPDPERVPWAHFLQAGVRGVGVYEGADGRVRGAWKPTSAGCVMGDGGFFCPVCREALVLRIYEFVDPIESATPQPTPASIPLAHDGEPFEFTVEVMQPASHKLEVAWWLFPASEAPPAAGYDPDAAAKGRRRLRGPLPVIAAEPTRTTRNVQGGVHRFELNPRDLALTSYVVIARATDTTELRGDKHPWVIKDEHDLLKSERRWVVAIEP